MRRNFWIVMGSLFPLVLVALVALEVVGIVGYGWVVFAIALDFIQFYVAVALLGLLTFIPEVKEKL